MIEGKLVIDGVELDITQDVNVPISFAVADIKNPQSRKRSSSKTIALPGTKTNMNFFSSAYQLSLGSLPDDPFVGFDFDPTIRIPARYYRKGVLIFDGLIQLLTVDIEKKDLTFNCVLFSNFVDLFQALGELKIGELGWSEYDHILNYTNIFNSWYISVKKNGVDTDNFTGVVPDGFGYVYPLINYGFEPNMRDIRDNNIFPHVYFREVLTKCFAVAGQTVTGSFIDKERFKRMIIGFSGGDKVTIPPSEIAIREVDLTATGSYAIESHHNSYNLTPPGWDFSAPDGYYTYYFNLVKNLYLGETWSPITVIADGLSQLDGPEIQVARTGKYRISFSGSYDVTKLIVGSYLSATSTANLKIQVIKNNIPVLTLLGGFTNATTVSFTGTNEYNFTTGDIIQFKFSLILTGNIRSEEIPSGTPPYFDLAFSDNSDWVFNMESIEAPLVNGDTVNVAAFLPDIKCSDFIKGLLTAYNLYVSDPNFNGEVEIETLDDYYEDTNVFDDWSLKLDVSKKQTISPASNIEGKNYVFRFMKDDDYWNKFYRNLYQNGYGDFNYQVPSTFQKGERVYELPWAQTVPVEWPGTNLIFPTIVQIDETTGVVKPYKGKPRVYYYQGLRLGVDLWCLRNSSDLSTVNHSYYPCASHIDNYTTPTFDFNFGVPELVQWTATDYTDVNLWSEYNLKPIKEITGKDSKILTAYFMLNEYDVQIESFKRLVMLNGVLFRRNLIKDFQANSNDSTLCELARIITAKKRRTFNVKPIPGTLTGATLISGGNTLNGSSPSAGLSRGERDIVDTLAPISYGGKK